MHFADKLTGLIEEKNSRICVGFDPELSRLPRELIDDALDQGEDRRTAAAMAVLAFAGGVIEAIAEKAIALKVQMAYVEMLGDLGSAVLVALAAEARAAGLILIIDGKRGDVEHTSSVYRDAYLGDVDIWGMEHKPFDADAMTVNPYMGEDCIRPYMDNTEKGAFILVKTSNPGSGDFQDLETGDGRLFEVVAARVNEWAASSVGESGYSSIGAVTGATYPGEAAGLRRLMPKSILLVPGYGAQGAGPGDIVDFFDENGNGALITASRSILFPNGEHEGDFRTSVRAAAERMRLAVNEALSAAGRPIA